jgi:hypothetical protein
MSRILHFLSKQVSQIHLTTNMFDRYKVIFDILSNQILPHLNMMKALRRASFRPINTCVVIDENSSGTRHK